LNALSRGIFQASDWLTGSRWRHDRGLVRDWDAKALIALQTHVVLMCLLGWLTIRLVAPDYGVYALSAACGASLVLFYTCVGARWVFRYKGAQQVKRIYASFWRLQVFKFILVVAFSIWVTSSSWVDPVSALIALAVMQCTPLCAGVLFPAGTVK